MISVQEKHYCGVTDSTREPEAEVMDTPVKGCRATSYVLVTASAHTHEQEEAKRTYQLCTCAIVFCLRKDHLEAFLDFMHN